MASSLSADGYETVLGIMGADAYLSDFEGEDRFGDYNYWIAFFGEPSDTSAWGWQFGGHHLGINITVKEGRSYMSPTFVGVEPAVFPAGAATITPLSSHWQAGRNLVNSLEGAQKAAGALPRHPDGIYTGAGQDGFIPPTEGSRAANWSDAQRMLLLEVAAQWVGTLDQSSAQVRLAEIQSELDDTYFAWHRGEGGPAYFCVQGPSLIIELWTESDPEEATAHYHTVYRNPANEYGHAISPAP